MPSLIIPPKIGIIVCLNQDGWHTDTPFVSYIIWNGKMLDEPDAPTCIRIVRAYEGKRAVEVVERTCIHCQMKLRKRPTLARER